jgi:hypothetical protein
MLYNILKRVMNAGIKYDYKAGNIEMIKKHLYQVLKKN